MKKVFMICLSFMFLCFGFAAVFGIIALSKNCNDLFVINHQMGVLKEGRLMAHADALNRSNGQIQSLWDQIEQLQPPRLRSKHKIFIVHPDSFIIRSSTYGMA